MQRGCLRNTTDSSVACCSSDRFVIAYKCPRAVLRFVRQELYEERLCGFGRSSLDDRRDAKGEESETA